MITIESALYGLIGWLMIDALKLDWPLQIPVLGVTLVVLALVALTALAGLLPARRAARISPVEALA